MASAKKASKKRRPIVENFPVIVLTGEDDPLSTGPPSPALSSVSAQTSTWTCPHCTSGNSHSTSICIACGKTKNAPLQQLLSTGYGWTCPRCTFFHSTHGSVCLMCSSPAGSIGIVEKFAGDDVENLRIIHEQDGVRQWEEIVAFCRRDNSPFVDDRFPPTQASLSMRTAPGFSAVQGWLRPTQLNQSTNNGRDGWTVCREPMASDIQQGKLGDCWFLSSLSVVAERPELIYNILLTKEYNREGAYLIRLCIDGVWQVILVDDLFPADEHGNLAFSKAGRQQLWVPLIEKALSKAHGSYYSIAGGHVDEGLMFLTGAPCERIPLDATASEDYDSVWARLLSLHSSGFLMGAGWGKHNQPLNEQECRAIGLRPRHAYSLLDVVDAGGLRLIRLRDPLGRHSWAGDWSANSKVLREQLLPAGDVGGLFWISLPDFVKYFKVVYVSKYRSHWRETRIDGKFPSCALYSQWSVWSISVTETTEVDLTLYQQGHRAASREMRHHHLDVAVLVFSVTQDGEVVESVAASQRATFPFVGASVVLDPGRYLCWTLAFNHFSHDMVLPEETFPSNVLAVHSAKPLVVERLPAAQYALADAIIFWAVHRGRHFHKKGSRHSNMEGVAAYAVRTGGLILVYENRYHNQSVHVVCDCRQSRDLVSTRGVLETVDLIPPRSRCVICILSPSHSGAYHTSYTTQLRVSNAGDGLGEWGPLGASHVPDIDTDMLRDLHTPRPL